MKAGLKRFRQLLIISIVLLGAAVMSSSAYGQCGLAPYKLQEEILAALQNAGSTDVDTGTKYWGTTSTGVRYTLWRRCTNPNFSAWNVNGSQNLPVLSAAIGLIRKANADIPYPGAYPSINPSGITYLQWWSTFLGTQTGILPPGNTKYLRYFKGTEMFSNIYDSHVVTAVVAVHYWAKRNNQPNLAGYALRYLRANWAVYALAAGTGPATLFNLPERRATTTRSEVPEEDIEYSPWEPLQLSPSTAPKYGGHFLALPGSRSDLKHWTEGDRPALLDRALRYTPPTSNEAVYQRSLLNYVNNQWNARWPSQLENVYGLTADDASAILTLIRDGSNATQFLAGGARPWLAGIRTFKTYRLMGWRTSTGQVRAAMIEGNPNGNTPCMFAVKYDGGQKIATFLYLWSDAKKSGGYPLGWSQLGTGTITADNGGGIPGYHSPMTRSITIPATQPLFHIVLAAQQESFDEKASPSAYPPYAPYDPWPFNPDSGDPDPPEN